MSHLPPAVLLGGRGGATETSRRLARAGVRVLCLGERSDPIRWSRSRPELIDLGSDGVQPAWLDWLTSTAPKGAVVIPCCDDGMELVARNRAALTGAGLVPVEGDDEAMLAALDKARTNELAEAAGVRTPRTVPATDRAAARAAAAEIGYPCLLKPASTHHFLKHFDVKMLVAQDDRELEEAVAATERLDLPMTVTELIPGGDDCLQGFYSYITGEGELRFHFTKRKLRQHPPLFGGGTLHLTDRDPEVAELGERVFRALGVRGPAAVEFKRDPRDGSLVLIECNNRISAAVALLNGAGIDLSTLTYRSALGLPTEVPSDYREGVLGWHPLEDWYALKEYRRRGELSAVAWTRSLRRPLVFTTATPTDPLPGIAPNLHRIPRVARKAARRGVARLRGPSGR